MGLPSQTSLEERAGGRGEQFPRGFQGLAGSSVQETPEGVEIRITRQGITEKAEEFRERVTHAIANALEQYAGVGRGSRVTAESRGFQSFETVYQAAQAIAKAGSGSIHTPEHEVSISSRRTGLPNWEFTIHIKAHAAQERETADLADRGAQGSQAGGQEQHGGQGRQAGGQDPRAARSGKTAGSDQRGAQEGQEAGGQGQCEMRGGQPGGHGQRGAQGGQEASGQGQGQRGMYGGQVSGQGQRGTRGDQAGHPGAGGAGAGEFEAASSGAEGGEGSRPGHAAGRAASGGRSAGEWEAEGVEGGLMALLHGHRLGAASRGPAGGRSAGEGKASGSQEEPSDVTPGMRDRPQTTFSYSPWTVEQVRMAAEQMRRIEEMINRPIGLEGLLRGYKPDLSTQLNIVKAHVKQEVSRVVEALREIELDVSPHELRQQLAELVRRFPFLQNSLPAVSSMIDSIMGDAEAVDTGKPMVGGEGPLDLAMTAATINAGTPSIVRYSKRFNASDLFFTFVIDTSGSMSGFPIAFTVLTVASMIARHSFQRSPRIILFSDAVYADSYLMRVAGQSGTIASTLAVLAGEKKYRGTSYLSALEYVASMDVPISAGNILVVMGDFYDSTDPGYLERVHRALEQIRLRFSRTYAVWTGGLFADFGEFAANVQMIFPLIRAAIRAGQDGTGRAFLPVVTIQGADLSTSRVRLQDITSHLAEGR